MSIFASQMEQLYLKNYVKKNRKIVFKIDFSSYNYVRHWRRNCSLHILLFISNRTPSTLQYHHTLYYV